MSDRSSPDTLNRRLITAEQGYAYGKPTPVISSSEGRLLFGRLNRISTAVNTVILRLPPITPSDLGKSVTVVETGNGSNAATILPYGTATISGNASTTLSAYGMTTLTAITQDLWIEQSSASTPIISLFNRYPAAYSTYNGTAWATISDHTDLAFTVPVTKDYIVNLSIYFFIATTNDYTTFDVRLNLDTDTQYIPSDFTWRAYAQHNIASDSWCPFSSPATLTAGNHTVAIQWKGNQLDSSTALLAHSAHMPVMCWAIGGL